MGPIEYALVCLGIGIFLVYYLINLHFNEEIYSSGVELEYTMEILKFCCLADQLDLDNEQRNKLLEENNTFAKLCFLNNKLGNVLKKLCYYE